MNKEREEKREQYERKIEVLKKHFESLQIPINTKWIGLEM